MKKERKTVLKKLCDLRELNFLLLSTNSVKSKVISDIYFSTRKNTFNYTQNTPTRASQIKKKYISSFIKCKQCIQSLESKEDVA